VQPDISMPTKEEALEAIFAHIRGQGWNPRIEDELSCGPDDVFFDPDDDIAWECVKVGCYCPHGYSRETLDITKYADSDRWVSGDGEWAPMWEEDCNCWGDVDELESELAQACNTRQIKP